VGVEDPEQPQEPGEHESLLRRRVHARPPEPMKPKQWAIAGAFIAILFMVGSVARGDVAPGIVGGLLAGVLCFMVLREISSRQWHRIREWDERHRRT
jgi:hypothetical protein